MSSQTTDVFAQWNENEQDPATMLRQLADHFREQQQPLELFEALKMQLRHRLGLPLMQTENDPIAGDELDRQLEQGLLAACDEVGAMLIGMRRVREGWMYLRPTGNTKRAAELIAEVPVNDDTADEIVEVLLHEAVDVPRGFQIILDRQGTCNSITTLDQLMLGLRKADREAAAAILLDHVYEELTTAVRTDIAHRGAPAAEDASLAEMVGEHPEIFENGAYHLDTSHLASTVRFARVLRKPEQVDKAWQLTQYGRRLHHTLQYPGDEPFVDFYPASASYFGVLMGKSVDSSLAIFQRKARSVDVDQHGTEAIEVYVDLLDRLGRCEEALRVAIELAPADLPAARLTPLLLDLAGRAGTYQPVIDYCRSKGDAIGFVAAQTLQHAAAS